MVGVAGVLRVCCGWGGGLVWFAWRGEATRRLAVPLPPSRIQRKHLACVVPERICADGHVRRRVCKADDKHVLINKMRRQASRVALLQVGLRGFPRVALEFDLS